MSAGSKETRSEKSYTIRFKIEDALPEDKIIESINSLRSSFGATDSEKSFTPESCKNSQEKLSLYQTWS